MTDAPLIATRGLTKHFPQKSAFFGGERKVVHALDDLTLEISRGEIVAVVGESGSGKSTCGRLILGLTKPTSGEILVDGVPAEPGSVRGDFQMVFQDPFGSLNPRMKVEDIIREPLDIQRKRHSSAEKSERVSEMLRLVGLNDSHRKRYPHEFSGGQRQRINIARALSTRPRFVVCDEPVSALDVSVQAQIVNLLRDIQRTLGVTILFISHDLSVVRNLANRVAVLYLGKLVEIGETKQMFTAPRHPYTKALLAAIPKIGGHGEPRRVIAQGDLPSPIDPPSGCRYRTRCTFAEKQCAEHIPLLKPVDAGRNVACHLVTADACGL